MLWLAIILMVIGYIMEGLPELIAVLQAKEKPADKPKETPKDKPKTKPKPRYGYPELDRYGNRINPLSSMELTQATLYGRRVGKTRREIARDLGISFETYLLRIKALTRMLTDL